MDDAGKLFLGGSRKPDDTLKKAEYLHLKFGNRHGLVTGATGTAKPSPCRSWRKAFSSAGVPEFCSDIKGDLSGIAAMGEPKDFLLKRASRSSSRNTTIPPSDDLLGSLWRKGPSGAHHHRGNGAAASGPPDGCN